MARGWSRRRGRQLLEVLPVDTAAALEAAQRIDAAIRPDFRRAVFAGIGALIALSFGSAIGNGIYSRELHTRLLVIGLAVVFVILGVLAVRSAANEVQRVVRARSGAAAGTTVRLLITLFGYLIILLSVLGVLAVPLGHLLVGGAITGVVVGIAAQQSLGNIFAGLMLLLARPYVIGEQIRVRSGALGGPFEGTVLGMDLLYTTLETDEGLVRLPNSGLLAAAVGPLPPKAEPADPVEPAGQADLTQPATTGIPATTGMPATTGVAETSELADSKHDAYRQPAQHDDGPQDPLWNAARHRGADLGPEHRAQRDYPRGAPGG